MYRIAPLDSIDYLIIGHVTQDVTPNGLVIGGTASYSSLTARALGQRVGIVTACDSCIGASELDTVPVAGLRSTETTTFENVHTPQGRIQHIHKRAPGLNLSLVPDHWRNPSIVHLAPVANEVDPGLVRSFPNSLIGLTPQGWMRAWDDQGKVRFSDWPDSSLNRQMRLYSALRMFTATKAISRISPPTSVFWPSPRVQTARGFFGTEMSGGFVPL
jgi:hypothetical protein